MPIEAPNSPTQVVKPVEAKIDQDVAMVTKRKMIVDRFIPSTQPSAQPQGGDCAPSPSIVSCPKKK